MPKPRTFSAFGLRHGFHVSNPIDKVGDLDSQIRNMHGSQNRGCYLPQRSPTTCTSTIQIGTLSLEISEQGVQGFL